MKINEFNYGFNSEDIKNKYNFRKEEKRINKNKNRNQYIWNKCEVDKFTKILFQKGQ